MTNTRTNTKRPIRFARQFVGSKFNIFAEPSRGIRLSTDTKVYTKVCEAYSEDEEGNAIILYPEDLVIPLSRGA